jgi:predicted secreted protein
MNSIGLLPKSVLWFLLLVLLASWGGATGSDGIKLIQMDIDYPHLEVHPEETFQIALRVKEGSLCQWFLDEYDEDHVEVTGRVARVPVGQSVGFKQPAHTVVWQLRGKEAGATRLRFLYYRPWEGEAFTEQTYEVRVVVNP